jgi:hypothetical protein
VRVAVLGVAALLVLSTSVIVAASPPNPGPFTGCLSTKTSSGTASTKGTIYNVAVSATIPLAACLAADTLVTFGNAQGPQGVAGPPGPTGPAGPSNVYIASDDGQQLSLSGTTLVSLTLPAGNYVIHAKTGVYNLIEDDIVDCLLKADTTVIDEDQVRLDGLGDGVNDNNEFMSFIGTASFSDTGTVALVCSSSSSASEFTQLLATEVETIHQAGT